MTSLNETRTHCFIWRGHACLCLAAALGILAASTSCTRAQNRESPVLHPEPVLDLGASEPQRASIAPHSFDRSDWTHRSVAPIPGAVRHGVVVANSAVEGDARARPFPSRDSALHDESSTEPTQPVQWLSSPVLAAWDLLRLPVALIFQEWVGARLTSPQPLLDRMPANDSAGGFSGIGFVENSPEMNAE